MNRRTFLQDSTQCAFVVGLGLIPVSQLLRKEKLETLTILHTNDVHSRIDPFPSDHRRYPSQGGAVSRKKLIDKIRSEEDNVLLLDAGDMMQGTPYFNFFNGKLEIEVMDELAYDAGTIGNHDFDAGIELLGENMRNASFPLLNCNYILKDTPLHDIVLPYKIIKKGKLKIGITGVGVELEGLVPRSLYGNAVYTDPIKSVNQYAAKLKKEHDCDLVILLSHLGLEYKTNKISDMKLAALTENIDIILGGHTHSFMSEPRTVKNKNAQNVLINQVGWAGLILGRIDVAFNSRKRPFSLRQVSHKIIEI